jgi:Fur family transcriptional regulator, ferric uptake regulator
MESAITILKNYIKDKGIRKSSQREYILGIFLKTEKHLTSFELYDLVKKKYSSIGYATVYRALKVFCESGIAEEIDIGDGSKRYEHKYGHEHHDHLICMKCGRFIEFINPEIEKIQERVADDYHFTVLNHKLQILGICNDCNAIKK